ncbi:MAG TPA: DHA2 family efflux MFS transporter permease subunit [Candidatus Binataceae bacterium]|nr:DHA2 family efflux MFS transporter permease subunit [Candidatus Binataceae bacterium]
MPRSTEPARVSAGDAVVSGAGKWLIAASVMLGTFMSVMDVTVVNVAMPHMMGTFGADLLTITWVSTAYSIAEIILITMSGWWTTLLGRKRFFLFSMIVFLIGSLLAGASHTLLQMILARILQGIGGGGLIPCAQAIARETFPPAEQGMAMAIFSMGVILAPALGPTLGGWLVDNLSWQWVFYINLPIGIVAIAMVSAFVHDPLYLKRGVQNIDWTGIVLLTIGLSTFQLVLERGEEVDWFSSNLIVLGTVVASVTLLGLVVWELYTDEPVINLRLLANPQLRIGTTLNAVIGFVLFGSSFALPQWTETLLGYPAMRAGMVLLPRPITMMIMMPIMGRLYNYLNPRIPVAIGALLQIYGVWALAHFPLEVGFANFAPMLVLLGLGSSCFAVTIGTISLSTMAAADMTGASSIFTVFQRVSANVAYASLATLLARRSQFHHLRLVHGISVLNGSYRIIQEGLMQQFMRHGTPAQPAVVASLMNSMLNRQATIMAYNDIFTLMVWLFGFAMLLIPLLPTRPPHLRSGAAAAH